MTDLPISIESMMKSAFEYELRNILPREALPPEVASQIKQYFENRIKEMNEHLK